LDRDKTYWWRIDTVKSNESVIKGNLWTSRAGMPELVGWWKFDETNGHEVVDYSGNDLNGEIIGDARIVKDAERGNVLSLDGDGDYVDFGNNLKFDITNEITIAAWVNIRNLSNNWMTIISKGRSAWRLSSFLNTRKYHFAVCGITGVNSVDGNIEVATDEWHHVCGTSDGKMTRLYVDGVLDTVFAYNEAIPTNNLNVCIGENQEAPGRYWDGLIDDVQVYSYAMSPGEIAAIYTDQELSLPDKPKWFFVANSEEPVQSGTQLDETTKYYVPLASEHEKLVYQPQDLSIICNVLSDLERLDPNNTHIPPVFCYWCALAHLGMGDTSGYRERCSQFPQFLDYFGKTDDPEACYWVAWACALAPKAVENLDKVVELAKLAVERGGGTYENRPLLGAILYRAGKFDEALQQLSNLAAEWEQGNSMPTDTSPAYIWFFQAMVHHQLGSSDEAKYWFDKAVKWSEEELQDTPAWNRKFTLQLLQAEARSLLGIPESNSTNQKNAATEKND
jgi:hypothetical protein